MYVYTYLQLSRLFKRYCDQQVSPLLSVNLIRVRPWTYRVRYNTVKVVEARKSIDPWNIKKINVHTKNPASFDDRKQ